MVELINRREYLLISLLELRQAICIPYYETSADNYLLSTLL